MKTLKTLSAALLMVLSFSAFAGDDDSNNEKLNVNYAVKTYMDAAVHGNIKDLAEVLHKEVKLTSPRGESILTYNKSEILNIFKISENVEQNCTVNFSILEATPTNTVAKVVMKYDNFSIVNYLNITNTPKGWKITSVSASYI